MDKKKYIFTLLFCFITYLTAEARHPMFTSVSTEQGTSIKTNEYLKNNGNKNGLSTYGLRYGISPDPNSWKSVAYHRPYAGIGFSYLRHEDDAFGHPLTLYFFQGNRITRIVPSVSLFYEAKLGYSFNWGHYDRYEQPNNICIGSSENVNVGLNLYLKCELDKHFDMNIGGGLFHFSNGANVMPNKGMNAAAAYIELAYKFNELRHEPDTAVTLPEKEGNFEHFLSATISARQIYHSTKKTGLSTQYVNHKFRVASFTYGYMKVQSYKFKWGPCLDVLYDESVGARAFREINPNDTLEYDRVYKGKLKDRFSIGISLRGEVRMPYCSYFANLGYDIIHGNEYDARLYEVIGVKADLTQNIFGAFGIRATNFSKAQFFCWTLGYRLVQD